MHPEKCSNVLDEGVMYRIVVACCCCCLGRRRSFLSQTVQRVVPVQGRTGIGGCLGLPFFVDLETPTGVLELAGHIGNIVPSFLRETLGRMPWRGARPAAATLG